MPWQATISQASQVAGTSFNATNTITADNVGGPSVILEPAKEGVLTTRTDANTGTLTMSPSHGITTGARLDLYWDGGQRRGITVGTVSGNSVPIDLGSGDDLPDADTAITAMVPNVETLSFSGTDAQFLQFGSNSTTAVAQVVITQADNTEITNAVLDGVLASPPWFEGSGFTNPLTGVTVGKVYCSHGDPENDVTVRCVLLYN